MALQFRSSSRAAATLLALASSLLLAAPATAQRLAESRLRAPHDGRVSPRPLQLPEPETARPSGTQVVGGYLGAMLVGFLAWRAFDSPAGQHPKVKDDWGYTPKANVALGVGSFVGATAGVWGIGRARGAKGKLWGTALGAALPTTLILMQRDDPLLPFISALFGAPVQGIFGYLGYKLTAP